MSAGWRAAGRWSPSAGDLAQPEERTLVEAAYVHVSAGRTEDEVVQRTFRGIEVERVVAELWHAAAADLRTGFEVEGVDIDWFAPTVATLNLMGIATVLPGESAQPAADLDEHHARVHLPPLTGDADGNDQLDALDGLVQDFRRSTIFVNGIGLVLSTTPDGVQQWSLTAAHPGIITAFGDFLFAKYVDEGWRLD